MIKGFFIVLVLLISSYSNAVYNKTKALRMAIGGNLQSESGGKGSLVLFDISTMEGDYEKTIVDIIMTVCTSQNPCEFTDNFPLSRAIRGKMKKNGADLILETLNLHLKYTCFPETIFLQDFERDKKYQIIIKPTREENKKKKRFISMEKKLLLMQ